MNIRFKKLWTNLRGSSVFHNTLVFLGFVVLSALFWVVMTMNDSMQEGMEVKISISDVPDTVTFITVPPTRLHVTVRDKGTSLMRSAMQKPTVSLNFHDFAQDGVFRISRSDFQAALKGAFGNNAVITSASIDSLQLVYTTNPGKRVPVLVSYDVRATNGSVLSGIPTSDPAWVLAYSSRNVLDTISRVYTERVVRRNLGESMTVETRLHPVPGVRFIPDNVRVSFNIETLVKKESMVDIKVVNVPDDRDLLLFPQKARVVYYVPMSQFGRDVSNLEVYVDYMDVALTPSDKLRLRLGHTPASLVNVELQNDSVEYTIVRTR